MLASDRRLTCPRTAAIRALWPSPPSNPPLPPPAPRTGRPRCREWRVRARQGLKLELVAQRLRPGAQDGRHLFLRHSYLLVHIWLTVCHFSASLLTYQVCFLPFKKNLLRCLHRIHHHLFTQMFTFLILQLGIYDNWLIFIMVNILNWLARAFAAWLACAIFVYRIGAQTLKFSAHVRLRVRVHEELGDHISRRSDFPSAGGLVLVVNAVWHAQVYALCDATYLRVRAAFHPPAVLVISAAARACCRRQLPKRLCQRHAAHFRRPMRQPAARRRCQPANTSTPLTLASKLSNCIEFTTKLNFRDCL